jgi:hypothetical protein
LRLSGGHYKPKRLLRIPNMVSPFRDDARAELLTWLEGQSRMTADLFTTEVMMIERCDIEFEAQGGDHLRGWLFMQKAEMLSCPAISMQVTAMPM